MLSQHQDQPHAVEEAYEQDMQKPNTMSDHVESISKDNGEAKMKVYGQVDHISYSEKESKRVKRKIDFILLPLMCGCYIFSFLDKTILNYSSIFGIQEALHLKGTNYSWLGSIFYIGYMVGSLAWSRLVQKYPQYAGKFISGAVCVWSILVLLTCVCYNFAGIMALRFFLGLLESITGPVFVILTSNWWTRSEQAFRTAFWLGGTPIGNFIGGLLTYALGSIHGAVATWKIFFLFFGSFSFAFSLILMYLLPDNQTNARWLNEREKKIAIDRVRVNQTVTADDKFKWHQFWEALKDPQTLFFFMTAAGNTMPASFANQFSSQIVKGFGFSATQATIISTCPAAMIQLSSFLIFSWIASKFNNIRLWLSMLVSMPPFVGAWLLHALPASNQAGRLAGYYLTYTHTMSFTLNTGLMAANYAGNTKKSTANGVIFAGWAAGLIAGPQFFLQREAPVYTLAFKMLMGCYALMIVLPFVQIAWYTYENRRRDRLAGTRERNLDVDTLEFTDKTDFEQWETFRYAM